MFSLHPQLEKDCLLVGNLTLCTVLLVNDSNYPWLILVPRRPFIREAYELSPEDQRELMIESNQVAATMSEYFGADKMNVAALGNMVPQLHIHHIVRYQSDCAWPGPVWGVKPAIEYEPLKQTEIISAMRKRLELEENA